MQEKELGIYECENGAYMLSVRNGFAESEDACFQLQFVVANQEDGAKRLVKVKIPNSKITSCGTDPKENEIVRAEMEKWGKAMMESALKNNILKESYRYDQNLTSEEKELLNVFKHFKCGEGDGIGLQNILAVREQYLSKHTWDIIGDVVSWLERKLIIRKNKNDFLILTKKGYQYISK